jgi:hypothetical protein
MKQLLNDVARECEEKIVINPDNSMFFDQLPQIPDDLPLAISDAVHNMRAAMDYLVYQLAKLGSGAYQDGTQFPIEDHKSRFDDRANTWLKHLRREHIDRIEQLQPYKGKEWTRTLRDLSNRDKHRHLTPITSEVANIFFTAHPRNSYGRRLPNGDILRAQPMNAVRIILRSGEAQIDSTLWSILAAVLDTVNAFNPDFN